MRNKFINTVTHKGYWSDEFKYYFCKEDGETVTWGKLLKENPEVAPFPLILDMEITTKCWGIGTKFGRMKERSLMEDIDLPISNNCIFCYKADTPNGISMSYENAVKIIDKLPKQLTQIAFGVDASLVGNKDWYKIFEYAKKSSFIPNVTIADINDSTAEKIANICGATAVSWYGNKDICYGTVEALTRYGMKQVNIHCMISQETLKQTYELIDDAVNDKRLKDLNAIVFLSLKKKGRGVNFHQLTQEQFVDIIEKCKKNGINYGFDSCSGNKFLNSIEGTKEENLSVYCTKCESTRESFYINVNGIGFPCSFCEGQADWKTGIDVLNCNDFITDVWQNPRIHNFREMLIMNNCNCFMFNI